MQKKIVYVLIFASIISAALWYQYSDNTLVSETIHHGMAKSEIQSSYDSLWDAAMNGTISDVEKLLASGINPNEYEEESALHAAAQKDDVAIAKLLLKHGANIHAKSYESGWTPLHQAAAWGHIEIAQLLVEHGAKVNEQAQPISQDVYVTHETPLHVAANAQQIEMVTFLVKKGADVNAQSASVGCYTPLHCAIAAGDAEIASYLIAHGGELKNNNTEPLLITACSQENPAMVTILLEHGCDINEQDTDGRTPLMMAIQCDNDEHVQILLEHHADMSIEDYQENTALSYAQESDNESIQELLLTKNV